MFDFLKRFKIIISICILFIFSFFIFSSHNKMNITSPLLHEEVMIFFTAPFQNIASSIGKLIGSGIDKYFFLVGLKEENKILRKENMRLRGDNYLLKEMELENIRLRDLLNFKKQAQFTQLLAAEVIAIDSRSDFRTIRINKGRSDGILEKMPVLTSEGIVGQIFKSYLYYSDILLITDRYSYVDAMIQRKRSRGILEGNISNCNLKYVLRSEDVMKGDLIITTGLDLVFPKGFPLGYVYNVTKEKFGIVQNVKVRPIVDFDKLEEVLVVLKKDFIGPVEELIMAEK